MNNETDNGEKTIEPANPVERLVMWFGRHEKTPRSGSRVIVKRKISGQLPSNPQHAGYKTGEWEQETIFGGTDFVCDLTSSGYVTAWRYDNDALCDFSSTEDSTLFTVADYFCGVPRFRTISRKQYFMEEIKEQPFFT